MKKNQFFPTILIACIASTAACDTQPERPTREEMQAQKMQLKEDMAKPVPERVSQEDAEPITGVEAGVPTDLLDRIAADAAERGKVPVENVRIVAARRETWPDGAMGCPVPGEVYTQMQTTGYHVIASVGLKKFDYRAGENGYFRICESPLRNKVIPAQ